MSPRQNVIFKKPIDEGQVDRAANEVKQRIQKWQELYLLFRPEPWWKKIIKQVLGKKDDYQERLTKAYHALDRAVSLGKITPESYEELKNILPQIEVIKNVSGQIEFATKNEIEKNKEETFKKFPSYKIVRQPDLSFRITRELPAKAVSAARFTNFVINRLPSLFVPALRNFLSFTLLNLRKLGIAGINGLINSGGWIVIGGRRFVLSVATATLTVNPTAWILIAAGVIIFFLLVLFINMTTQSAFLKEEFVQPVSASGSQYIDAQITMLPDTTSFKNEDLPQEVQFTIKVRPKKIELTDISITMKALIDNINGTQELKTETLNIEKITTEFEKTYSIKLENTNNFKNSFITVSFNIAAAVFEQPNKQTATISKTLIVGNPPDECPSGWPTVFGWITQGPFGGSSHSNAKAIDIGRKLQSQGDILTQPVFATHAGTVSVIITKDPITQAYVGYGIRVEIEGICNGKPFKTLYAHLFEDSVIVKNGDRVKKGDMIAKVGSTGASDAPHLHYEFKGDIPLAPPFIPKAVPTGCIYDSCGNITWN